MTKYVEPEFKAILSTTEDVLTASPILGSTDFETNYDDDIMPFVGISG